MELQVLLHPVNVVEDVVNDAGDNSCTENNFTSGRLNDVPFFSSVFFSVLLTLHLHFSHDPLHGVCLAGGGLAVSEDGAIIAVENI